MLTPAQQTQQNQQSVDAANAANSASGKISSTPAPGSAFVDPATNQPATGQVSPIASTPTVISSKDMASGFAQNSATLAQKTPSQTSTQITLGNGQTVNVDSQGNFTDMSGNPVSAASIGASTAAPSKTVTGSGTDATSTAVEKGAAGGAGTGAQPIVSTGDPIYDSLQTWEQDQETKNEANAAAQKQQVQQMLTTNLAANDATYAAQIQGIQNTYSQLIDTQTRINNLNTSRVKAYGLSSGNAMGTPIEFTYAVSNEEQTGAAAIQKLDDSRDSLIATAQAAQQSGDAKLLSDSMASIDQIEKDMQTQAQALQSQVDTRFQTLQGIEKDQQAQLAATQQNLLAAAVTQYGQQFADETDPTKKDALIKQIITSSGGQLDYGTVFGSLTSNAATLTAAKTQTAKDNASLASSAADVALKGAQTTEAYAAATKDATANNKDEVYGALDNYINTPAAKQPGGVPVLDDNGYFTQAGFQNAVSMARENGVNMQTFLGEYGGYIDPGAYDNYGLTKAQQAMLTNQNKTTPIVVQATTQ